MATVPEDPSAPSITGKPVEIEGHAEFENTGGGKTVMKVIIRGVAKELTAPPPPPPNVQPLPSK